MRLWLVFALLGNIALAQGPDLRGPIASPLFQVRSSAAGIFTTDFRYAPSPPSPWHGRWIWIDSLDYPGLQATRAGWMGAGSDTGLYVVDFKKVIRVDGEVATARLKISADVGYRLFINGKLSGRGPANIGSDYGDTRLPRHWFYDDFDARFSFRRGINVIAIEVATRNPLGSAATMGRAGLILDGQIRLRSGRTLALVTDTSWVCTPSEAYRPDGTVDATRQDARWITSPGIDRTWSHAVVLPDSIASRWRLRQSELPPMMERRVFPTDAHFPLVVKASARQQTFRFAFDNLYTGYLGFRVTGAAGTRLAFATAETEGHHAQEMTYVLSAGTQTYESPRLMDGQYVYVTVSNPGGDLTLGDVVFDYSSFPVSYPGSFVCSDPFLNALWTNIRWVVQMNMQTYHMDSPLHQEPVSDAGDYLIESLVNYYAFASPWLVRQDLRKIALVLEKTNYRMFHTSYMLLWVQMLLHYYDYTGDKALLSELAPDVYRLLDRFGTYVGPTGIVTDAPNYMFMDWGSLYGIGFHHPPASWGQGYMTAFYYKGLLDGSEIARCLGDTARSARFTHRAAAVKQAFAGKLYDKERRLFSNGIFGATSVKPHDWLPADTAIAVDLPYVNTLAVLYGLTPPGTADTIMHYVLTQKDVTPSPYFMYFVFDALAAAGEFDSSGMAQLRRWALLSRHPTGLREGWAMGDYSHAWGGSPAYELSSRVLGVLPAKPGFKEVLVAPHPGDLDSAAGVVPTPLGPVHVRWRRGPGSFVIEVATPEAMPVTIILPFDGRLFYKGKPVPMLPGRRFRTHGGRTTLRMVPAPSSAPGGEH